MCKVFGQGMILISSQDIRGFVRVPCSAIHEAIQTVDLQIDD